MPEKADPLTLTKVTKFGRSFVKYFAITLVVLMIVPATFKAVVALARMLNPPPPPAPTVGFGKLPPPLFPEQDETDKPASYILETATGDLPTFGDRAFVYLLTKNNANLLDNENAKKVATRYGFTGEAEQLDSKTYRWTRVQPLRTTFDFDIIDHNFTYQTDYLSHPELILQSGLPSDFDAVQQVKSFLQTGGLMPNDLASSSAKIAYLKAIGGVLKPAVSVSDADFVSVSINRYPVSDMYNYFTPDGVTGTIQALLTGGRSANSLLSIQLRYFPADYTQPETYPLRTTREAWNILQAGEGYIAQKGTEQRAVIRSVELGYFESFEYQSYLQPMYVFTGDAGFIGYVPAITSSYLLQSANP